MLYAFYVKTTELINITCAIVKIPEAISYFEINNLNVKVRNVLKTMYAFKFSIVQCYLN